VLSHVHITPSYFTAADTYVCTARLDVDLALNLPLLITDYCIDVKNVQIRIFKNVKNVKKRDKDKKKTFLHLWITDYWSAGARAAQEICGWEVRG